MRDLGIDDPDFFAGFAKQILAVNSDGKGDQINSNFEWRLCEARSHVIRLNQRLAMQMTATHRLIMGCTRRF